MNGKRRTLKLIIPENFLTKTSREAKADVMRMELSTISRTKIGLYRELRIQSYPQPRHLDRWPHYFKKSVKNPWRVASARILEEANEIIIWPFNPFKYGTFKGRCLRKESVQPIPTIMVGQTWKRLTDTMAHELGHLMATQYIFFF